MIKLCEVSQCVFETEDYLMIGDEPFYVCPICKDAVREVIREFAQAYNALVDTYVERATKLTREEVIKATTQYRQS